jgi:hypothetical protein
MKMDGLTVLLAVLLWLLLLAVALQQGRPSGASGQVATWLLLTALTLAFGSLVAWFAVYGLLFSLGREAALVGLVVSGVLLALAPLAWGRVIRHRARHTSAHGRPRS